MKIAVIDDHPLVRKGLTMILELEEGIEVCGEAAGVGEGIELIISEKPELALIDLRLGTECGLDIIEKVLAKGYKCKFAVITSSVEREDFGRSEAKNVAGYISKDAHPEEILYAIRLMAKGRKYYDPCILDLMIKKDENPTYEELTPREKDVLAELGNGLSNIEIAKKLFITEYTVKKHVSQILAKLNLSDRTQAALYANNKGLVKKKL
jgi:two-component system, NarL family, nitrate/nitrite response regulator NarL